MAIQPAPAASAASLGSASAPMPPSAPASPAPGIQRAEDLREEDMCPVGIICSYIGGFFNSLSRICQESAAAARQESEYSNNLRDRVTVLTHLKRETNQVTITVIDEHENTTSTHILPQIAYPFPDSAQPLGACEYAKREALCDQLMFLQEKVQLALAGPAPENVSFPRLLRIPTRDNIYRIMNPPESPDYDWPISMDGK